MHDGEKSSSTLPEVAALHTELHGTLNGPMRGVTLRQLRAFASVARYLSFARAASELRLSPSAVSLQIKELEAAVRLPLIDRATKTLSLTTAGDVLLPEVSRVLAAMDHAGAALDRLRGGRLSCVAVGMVSNAQYFVPRLVAEFHEGRRDVELSLAVGSRELLLDQLHRGEIDLAIIGTPPDGYSGHADRFASQPLGIVASRNHPLAGRAAIELSELVRHDFIVRESGSGTRSAMERFFRSAHLELPRAMQMSSNEAIKQAAMANMGLAFLSLHTAALELRTQLLVSLDVVGLPLVRPWYVVSANPAELGEAVGSLRRFILDVGHRVVAPTFGPGLYGLPLDVCEAAGGE
jgi:DNA-binding transcriptional LysR family regulator